MDLTKYSPGLVTLIRNRDFRLLYIGQTVSFFGSTMTNVALPYQLYQQTNSTALLGAMGVIGLAPALFGGIFGGTLADAVDRRRLIILCELGMAVCVAVLTWASRFESMPIWSLLIIAFILATLNGLHRPALEALTPQLVATKDIHHIGSLNAFKYNIGTIIAPAVAGLVISHWGISWAYALDGATFAVAIAAAMRLNFRWTGQERTTFSFLSFKNGLRYAQSRQELIGTYLADIAAMTFSMPNLLFPAVAQAMGGAHYLGLLHSTLAGGSLLANFTCGWSARVRRQGMGVLMAAGSWSLFMGLFGLGVWAKLPAVICLVPLAMAGYADMISGVFRLAIWNQSIPETIRGRMAGIEMISYTTGPLLGNTQLGFLAGFLGMGQAIAFSSGLGLIAIMVCAWRLPRFRSYLAPS